MNAIICLIDESSLMDVTIKPSNASRKPLHKMSAVMNSINGFLGRLSETKPACKVAVVGYSTDSNDQAIVQPRLGDDFVMTSELDSIVRRVESRVQKVPSGDGFTFNTREVDVAIWCEAEANGKSCQIAGFDFTKNLIAERDELESVVVVHIFGGSSADGNPVRSVKALEELDRSVTVFQVHIGSTESVPATAFPRKQATLTSSFAQDLFNRSASLDDQWRQVLQKKGFGVGSVAQGLVYNSHMVDLARLLAAIEEVAGMWTEAPSTAIEEGQNVTASDSISDVGESKVAEVGSKTMDDGTDNEQDAVAIEAAEEGSVGKPGRQLVVMAIDCSVEDPFASSANGPVSSHANNMGNFLEHALKVGQDRVDIGIVTYCKSDDGSERIQSRLETTDDPFFPAAELMSLALRVDSFVEEIPNGAGGLIEIPHERPVLLDLEPSLYCSPESAFGEVGEIVNAWRTENATGMTPIIVHLTRGVFEGDDLETAVNNLKESTMDSVLVYHWISSPKLVVSTYPAMCSSLDGELAFLNPLVAASAQLVNAEEIAVENSNVKSDSVGLVCNGRFDFILDSVTRARESNGASY